MICRNIKANNFKIVFSTGSSITGSQAFPCNGATGLVQCSDPKRHKIIVCQLTEQLHCIPMKALWLGLYR